MEYDSDDDGAPMIGPGGARRGGGEQVDEEDNGVDDMDNGEDDIEDDIKETGDEDGPDQDTGAAQGGQAIGATQGSRRDRRVINDEESEDEEEGGEIREGGSKTTGLEEEDYHEYDRGTGSGLGGEAM